MLNKMLAVILTFFQLSALRVLGCGILHHWDARGRILHGQDADPSDFPFIVRLEVGEVLCAGTIIADQWVLTTAHCLDGLECEKIEIFPSTWAPNSTSIAKALECHIHEKFDNVMNRNDIGLIKSSEDLVQDGLTAAIPLPDPGKRFPVGTSAIILGWGAMDDAAFPDHLMRGDVEIESWETCNWKQKHHLGQCESHSTCSGPNMSEKIICTQGKGLSPPSNCIGDSGSPVIAEDVLVGITSYTLGYDNGCVLGAPSMQVSVVDQLPWIYSFIDPDKDTSQMEVLEDPDEE